MSYKSQTFDDEPVTRSRRARVWEDEPWPQARTESQGLDQDGLKSPEAGEAVVDEARPTSRAEAKDSSRWHWPTLRHGHALSFAGLLLFTAVVYFRPYELIPALSGFTSMAFWLAVATLIAFFPTQLGLEGTLTARPREINLALLLLLAALLSVPLAIDRVESWWAFVDFAKVITMFVVMVNVVRTERRWRLMVWLALLVSVVLSAHALSDYLSGNLVPGADRITGFIGSLFDNPNDLALHLVTMIPLAFGLVFVARGPSGKLLYASCALLMLAATVVTFSRGGFLGLMCALFVLAWKLGRGRRLRVLVLFAAAAVVFFVFVPSDYTGRLLSSFGNADGGSASTRQELLWRSLAVTLRNPLLGVGMNNFHIVSIHEKVSHNAYTQVSAEMGVAALVVYVMFIWAALKRLRGVERATYDARRNARVYYLAVGLQASLVGFMVSSFFASVAYLWYIYYLVGYALCLHRLYEAAGAEGVFGRAPAGRRPSVAAALSEPLAAHREQ